VSYLTTVIADAPIHFWRCADGGGQIAHDIGSAPFHLIASGQAARLGYSGPNSNGGSLICPGGGADINSAGGNIASLTSPFSVEAWIWMFAAPAAFADVVGWSAFNAGLTLQLNTNRTLQATLGGTFPAQSGAISTQAWHQLAMTYDGTTIRQYVDGAASTTVAKAGPVTVTQQFAIGADPSTANSFEGFISEVSIYGTTLSATQILAHFNAVDTLTQAPVFTTTLGNAGVSGVNSGVAPAGLAELLALLSRTFPAP
jgi:Concanavalin A-like lectin/glucanases superfamily